MTIVENILYVGGNAATAAYNFLEHNCALPILHLTPEIETARVYGSKVLRVVIEGDLDLAHKGMINKDGNFNPAVGNGIEYVLQGAALNELVLKAVDWSFVK